MSTGMWPRRLKNTGSLPDPAAPSRRTERGLHPGDPGLAGRFQRLDAPGQCTRTVSPGRSPYANPAPARGQQAHEIDFEIFGSEMQFVEIELDPGESVISEAGP